MLFASKFNICNIFCLLNSHSDLAAHLIESLHCFGTCSLAIRTCLTRCCSLNCTGFQELPGTYWLLSHQVDALVTMLPAKKKRFDENLPFENKFWVTYWCEYS